MEDRAVPAFLSSVSYTGAGSEVKVGDFNGDGIADLVTNGAGTELSVRLGTGTGGFGAAKVSTAAPSGYALGSMAVGDFNRDDRLDVAVSSVNTQAYGKGSVSVLLGRGDGTFRTPKQIILPKDLYRGSQVPGALAAGDMNNDGILDLVVVGTVPGGNIGFTRSYTNVLLGQGSGGFPRASTTSGGATRLALADVNGDGRVDVLRSSTSTFLPGGLRTTVSLLVGNGNGALQPIGIVAQFAGASSGPAVADFNGDGTIDLAMSSLVFLGNGDATFRTPVNLVGAGTGPTVGDVNHDGNLDIVTHSAGAVNVNLGNGDGTFQAAQTFAAGANPRSVVVGDFNGDGWADLVQTNTDPSSGTDSLLVLMNDSIW